MIRNWCAASVALLTLVGSAFAGGGINQDQALQVAKSYLYANYPDLNNRPSTPMIPYRWSLSALGRVDNQNGGPNN